MSVWEVALVTVAEGKQEEFASVLRAHLPLLRESGGCLDVKLLRAIDKDGAVLVCLEWPTLEHHTEAFVGSEPYDKLASAVLPFFIEPAQVFHANSLIDGF